MTPATPSHATAPRPDKHSAPRRAAGRLLSAAVKPDWVVPLAAQIGTSSFFVPLGVVGQTLVPSFVRDLDATLPMALWNLQDFRGGTYSVVDGGGADTNGITPLLRRRTRAIIACVANAHPIGPGSDAQTFAARQYDVFPVGGYPRLYAAAAAAAASGGPALHLDWYTTLPNAYHAVAGGWNVTVLWIFNSRAAQWEAALPPGVAARLAQVSAGNGTSR
ncbi:hypothetical protein MNEG_13388 [Monoraphidium neglectum]|uniref:Uncharacterized protein n=1 Tax=Monoraphidium neglectum TaxID=145388 RepID=A0A0D2LSD6_9CHLO|nr:hypothetical protein MNEG_13388 [Monoraphidium neglectum]KIY94574.1 hypothetical protein MNEG_13388 [Monoraphidium neglectum]|eukprot:XP_013893594.1 hypothetical protein MNEG_13388 [Monoraphidium neglectum]